VPAMADMRVSALEGVEFPLSSGNHPGSMQQGEVMAVGCVSSEQMIFTTMVFTLARREVMSDCPTSSGQIREVSGKAKTNFGHSILKSLF
jgi:hypothetical protein